MVQQRSSRGSTAPPGTSKIVPRRTIERYRVASELPVNEERLVRVRHMFREDNGGNTLRNRLLDSLRTHDIVRLKAAIRDGADVNARTTTSHVIPFVILSSVHACWLRNVGTREEVLRRFTFWTQALAFFIASGVDLDTQYDIGRTIRGQQVLRTPRREILENLRLCSGHDFEERMWTRFNIDRQYFGAYRDMVREMLQPREQ